MNPFLVFCLCVFALVAGYVAGGERDTLQVTPEVINAATSFCKERGGLGEILPRGEQLVTCVNTERFTLVKNADGRFIAKGYPR